MITRTEYMADSANLHQAYYSQAVTPSVIAWVESRIGVNALLASTNPHLNDIPLGKWDAFIQSPAWPAACKILRDTGDTAPNTLGCAVCVAKAAARQIISAHKASE